MSNFEWSAGAKPIEDSSFEWSAGAKPIKSEETSQLPKKERSFGEETFRQVGRTGRGLATGIASIGDIPNIAAMGLHAAGLKETPTFYKPLAQSTQETIDELTGDYLRPESETEEMADALIEGVAPLALAPFTGGASLTSLAAREGAKQLGKGAAKKAAERLARAGSKTYAPTAGNIAAHGGSSLAVHEYLKDEDNPELLEVLAAGLAGGAGASALTKIPKLRHPVKSLKNKIADVYGERLGIDPEMLARNEALGLPVTASQVSAKPSTLAREEILRHHPASRNKFIESDVSREREIARNLGVSDPEDLKQTVKNIDKSVTKEGAEGYTGRVGKIFEHYEKKFANRENQAIANRELVDVSDIHNELSQAARGLKKTKELKDFENTTLGHFKKQIEEYAESSLTAKDISNLRKQGFSDDIIAQFETPNKTVGYAGLEALRKEAKNVRDSFKRGTEQYKDASRIYDMLSRKRHEFMETTGNAQEKHAAKRARKVYAQYAGNNEKLGQKNYKKYVLDITESPNEANAFEKLISKDPKYLHVTRVGLPKNEQRRLGESLMEHLGKQQGRFNINKAHTRFDNLEPSIQAEFLQTLPKNDRKNFLDTMDLISENKQGIEKIANTSRSAHTLITHQAKDDIFKAASKGDVKGVLTQLMKNGLYRLDGYVYTDQTFLKRMADMAKARNAKELTNRTDLLLKSPVIKSAIRSSAANAKEDKKGSEKKKSPHITIYATQSGRPN